MYKKGHFSLGGGGLGTVHLKSICQSTRIYTPLAKLLAQQARLGTIDDGSGNKAENYSSISITNQNQLTQKMYK